MSCYALLSDKAEESYKDILKAVFEKSADLGFPLNSFYVHLDFELPVVNADKLVFGHHINFIGSFCHLTQSTWMKVQELGLMAMMMSISSISVEWLMDCPLFHLVK